MKKKATHKVVNVKQRPVSTPRNVHNLTWESLNELNTNLLTPIGGLIAHCKGIRSAAEVCDDEEGMNKLDGVIKMITADATNFVKTVTDLTGFGKGKTGPITDESDIKLFAEVGMKAETLATELEQLMTGSFASLTSIVFDIESRAKETRNV